MIPLQCSRRYIAKGLFQPISHVVNSIALFSKVSLNIAISVQSPLLKPQGYKLYNKE